MNIMLLQKMNAGRVRLAAWKNGVPTMPDNPVEPCMTPATPPDNGASVLLRSGDSSSRFCVLRNK